MARHAHITKNNKFFISLQDFKKEVSDAVNILHATARNLQGDTITIDGHDLAFSKYSK